MLKKSFIIIILITAVMALFGQGLKADLQSYAKQMEAHQDLVSNPTLESLLDRISNDDTEALYELIEFLQGDYLNSLQSYLQAIIPISPKTVKVKFLHSEFLESYDALYRALSALSKIDKSVLRAAEDNLEAEVPEEYNDFVFGINLFSVKMNTYNALNRELSFLMQFE
ncbi:MAG: hypothetical protein WC155_00490 [Candidatus Cloacimonadales bacterium]